MSLSLYINGGYVELLDRSKIGLTRQVNVLDNLENRQGDLTNEFLAPKTLNNQLLLENSSNVNSLTDIPYKKNGAKIIQDGVETVPEGFAIIQSFSNVYKITVYSGNLDLFELISDRKLNELDLSDLNHNFDFSTVVGSETNTSGYIYPGVSFRKYTSNLNSSNEGRVPFTFVSTLCERIASEQGYSLSGTFTSDFYYLNTILSTVFKHDESWQLDKSVSSIYPSTVPNTDIYSSTSPTTVVYSLGFPNQGHLFGQIYTVPEDGSYSFNIIMTVDFAAAFFTNFAIEVVNIGTATIVASDYVDPSTFTTGTIRTYTYNVDTGYIALSAGDQIQFRASADTPGIGIYNWSYISGSQIKIVAKNAYRPYSGSAVDMSYIQPDIKQKDFFKAIMNMFCLIPQTNVVTKTIYLNKLNEIKNNIDQAINWSSKMDTKKAFTIEYRNNSFAQKNWLRYSNDDDVIEKIKEFAPYETDNYFEINDEVLDKEQDVVTLPFSGTIRRIPYKNDDYSIDPFTPRILVLAYRHIVPTSIVAIMSDISYQKGISFYKNGTNDALIDNYQVIEEIFDKYKKITGYFNLSAVDISELNFLIPIYLDVHTNDIQVNGHFYLNKVENFKGGELTKCELIRL